MASLPPAYFDALYGRHSDPWGFATSEYEAGKYIAALAALPRDRYASALEIGCSIGVLTHTLALRCYEVLAIDVADVALQQAQKRNIAHRHVRFERQQFPAAVPHGTFDLIVLSEILYYLDRPDLADAALAIRALARAGAHILLVHWLGPTPDYPLSGDQAAEDFIAALLPDATLLSQLREPDYRIDLLRL